MEHSRNQPNYQDKEKQRAKRSISKISMSGSKIHKAIEMIIMNNWSIHKAFQKAIKNRTPSHASSPVIHIYAEDEQIPIEAWEDALVKSATFVEQWGVKYLPIFERVERELEKARQQLHSLEKAKSIATRSLSHINDKLRQQSYLIEP